MKKSDILKVIKEVLAEEKPGLWANIRAKRARGEKPAHKNSNAHKDAVKAGKKINAMKEEESELSGYLVSDVVDDIIKALDPKMVKGQVEDAPNSNYVYLKLTDKKFANDVIGSLKSKFGIDGKYDTTFGHQPTVSFSANNVIKENETKTFKKGDELKIKLPNGKEFDLVFVDYSRTKGVGFGKFKDENGEYDVKPFDLSTVVSEVNEGEGKALEDLQMGEKFTFNGKEYTFIELYPELPNAARVVLPDGRKSVVSFGGGVVNTGKKAGIGPDAFGQGKGHHID